MADLGVLVPIAVALVVGNGLSPTAVLVPAGLLYLAVAALYRLPVPVQPLKAFGVIAVAHGVGVPVISAGAWLIGALFLVLGLTGAVDAIARWVPRPVVRGIQLAVGLLLLRLALDLVVRTPAGFADQTVPVGWLAAAALATATIALLARTRGVTLLLVLVAMVTAGLRVDGPVQLGPSPTSLILPSAGDVWTATVLLVLPQLPLTVTNSCVATADAARHYFGEGAHRVRPGRLATSLGVANVITGLVGGMPLCHGAGGLSAHRGFGARTGGAPFVLGMCLVGLGVLGGAGLAGLLSGFPVSILAGLLLASGVMHLGLLRDLTGLSEWTVAALIGCSGLTGHLALVTVLTAVAWRMWHRRPAADPRSVRSRAGRP